MMVNKAEYTEGIRFIGLKTGWLCLDFANTVDWHASPNPVENLLSYADLVDWAMGRGIITAAEAKAFLSECKKNPVKPQSILKRGIELREAIYHILAGLAHSMSPRMDDMAILNQFISEMMANSRIIPVKNKGFVWTWKDKPNSLDYILWAVARSASEFLTSDAAVKVGQCADERGCGCLFVDASKNRTRRWCDMGDCGNRAKARRHYQKQQGMIK
jgi:predicted RNA-binding Zn ribbon-like protein